MLVGLTAKNAILIVEFAKERLDQGKPLIDAALEGARLRLRPILVTSFAFVFGCVPPWIAKGAGASARQMLGTAVASGMPAATLLGVFLIAALFVTVDRLGRRKAVAETASNDSADAPGRRQPCPRRVDGVAQVDAHRAVPGTTPSSRRKPCSAREIRFNRLRRRCAGGRCARFSPGVRPNREAAPAASRALRPSGSSCHLDGGALG